MKKIYLFLASIAMVYGATAQEKFWIDYATVDKNNQELAGNAAWFDRSRPMHMRYTKDTQIMVDGIATSSVTTYVVVAFNSLIDDNGAPVSGNVTSLLVDSLAARIYHKNNSGKDDTLIVKILDVDNNGYPMVDNAPIWSETLIGKDFDASNGYGTLKLNPAKTLPGGKSKFAVRLDFYGDLTDTLMFVYGFATTGAGCNCGTMTSPTTVPGAGEPTPSNSFTYIIKPNKDGKTGLSPTKTGEEIYNMCGCVSPTQNISIIAKVSATVGVEENKAAGLKLYQNQPNPFNTTSVITYELAKQAKVSLEIYDITGRKLTTINEGDKNMGKHNITIEANKFAKGLYFYTLKVNEYSLTQRMVIAE